MKVFPYLSFNGQCEEAFKYYQERLGAKILFSTTWGDSPMAKEWPDGSKKIMHATLSFDGSEIAGADMPPGQYQKPQGFALALAPKSVADAERLFQALAEGGKVEVPLQETFWAARFGQVVDRFGISWMVNCEQSQETKA